MIPKFNVLTPDQVQQVHDQSIKILEEIGVEFSYQPALDALQAKGQRVEGQRVYFQRKFVEAQVAKAPAEFTLHARNPQNNLIVGGENIIFMPGYGSPFIHEADGTRRTSVMNDYNNFVKLSHMSANMHMTGGTAAEPTDIPDAIRHLKMAYSSITLSDKCFMGSASGYEKAQDSIEMAAILFGGKSVIKDKPALICLINSVTPLKYDDRMLGALMAYAQSGQAMVIASLVMAGSTGPATMAGRYYTGAVCQSRYACGVWFHFGHYGYADRFVIHRQSRRRILHFSQCAVGKVLPGSQPGRRRFERC
jgi:trimethylamine--corrinoid protein Co-methyltransferase